MNCLAPIPTKADYLHPGTAELEPLLIHVGCGKCIACTSRKASSWSTRLVEHTRYNGVPLFITLTYSDDQLHYTLQDESPDDPDAPLTRTPTLVKQHLARYLKTIKQWQQEYFKKQAPILSTAYEQLTQLHRLSYYACGEYGSLDNRPHYHVLLWGLHPELANELQNIPQGTTHSTWDKGWTTARIAVPADVPYTTKYVIKYDGQEYAKHPKKIDWPSWYSGPKVAANHSQPYEPFHLMSKGLGRKYAERHILWHKPNENPEQWQTKMVQDGIKKALPRYYKDVIWRPQTSERYVLNSYTLHQRANSERAKEGIYSSFGETSPTENYLLLESKVPSFAERNHQHQIAIRKHEEKQRRKKLANFIKVMNNA